MSSPPSSSSSSSSPSPPTSTFYCKQSPTEEWTINTIQGIQSDQTLTRRVSLSDAEKDILVSLLKAPNNKEIQTIQETSLSKPCVDICVNDIPSETIPAGRCDEQAKVSHPTNQLDKMDSQADVEELCNLLTRQMNKQHYVHNNDEEKVLLEYSSTDIPSILDPEKHILNHSISSNISIDSEEEVRVEKMHSPTGTGHDTKISSMFTDNNVEEIELDDESSASSWNMELGGFRHYDAWTVLQDEYALDFGFGGLSHTNMNSSIIATNPHRNTNMPGHPIRETSPEHQQEEEEDDDNHEEKFLILGTSIDDANASPHVLSPPLMLSLTQFLPESLIGQNFWLKYSLIRDGACMDTLLRYVRAAQHTILAIETTDGHVLGSFTSNTWKVHPHGYYGSGEAFVWAMRYSRMTPCYSLYDQAQLESDIDVFPFSALNSYIQLCTEDHIAVGGGTLPSTSTETTVVHDSSDLSSSSFSLLEEDSIDDDTDGERMGSFAIMIQKDLTQGVSCPSATFRNPCLIHHSSTSGETFQIVNVEVWTLTPCMNVDDAEKLEMRKFFIDKSMHSSDTKSSSHSSLGKHDYHHHHSQYSHSPTDDHKTLPRHSPYSHSPTDDHKQLPRQHMNQQSGTDLTKKGFYRRVGEDENDVGREGQDQEQGWY